MKRRKDYMPRRGIHFDRRHVNGSPDGSFIGTSIDVAVLTGSVMASITERDSSYSLNSEAIVGYPRSPVQMGQAVGYANWYNDSDASGFGFDYGDDFSGLYSYDDGFGNEVWIVEQFEYRDSLGVLNSYDNAWDFVTFGTTATETADWFSTSGIGPRAQIDSANPNVAEGGFNKKTDFSLRFRNTGSYFSALHPIHNVAGTKTLLWASVFKFDDVAVNCDFAAKGCTPTLGTAGWRITLETGSLTLAVSDASDTVTRAVPLAANTWYAAMATATPAGNILIGAIPFWGGEVVLSSLGNASAVGTFGNANNVRLGDNGVFRASNTLDIAANYISAVDSTDDGNLDSEIDGERNLAKALRNFQRCVSSFPTVTVESDSDRVSKSIGSFGSDLKRRYLNQKLLGLGTGALGRSFGAITLTTGTIPSFSNVHTGHNAAFIISTLSSSDHESQVMNCYRSGSEALETTPVPGSASLYYSKKSAYNKIIVKKSASFFDTIPPPPPISGVLGGATVVGAYVPALFVANSGSRINTVTGSTNGGGTTTDSERDTPATIFFNVPVKGRLVDIAVWVELHCQSGSQGPMPLGSLEIGLRSPNVAWEGTRGRGFDVDLNTFTLWRGYGQEITAQRLWESIDGGLIPASYLRERVPSWDRDLDMRTVFHDGGSQNVRHLLPRVSPSGNYQGSPNAALGINSAWGMSVSWTGSSGSPPNGWLSGPGGSADTNEWPTTGSNRGAALLRPFFPLLDDITLSGTLEAYIDPLTQQTRYRPAPAEFRPGLRGTEISGTWHLSFAYQTGDDVSGSMPIYFRQARLEITYEENYDIDVRRPYSSVTARRSTPLILTELSQSTLFISGTYNVYLDIPSNSEVNRTFGVVLNTGSINQNSHALLYRLTGTLADISGTTPGWLLNNSFGMPRIPLSSASLVDATVEQVKTIHPQDLIAVRPILDGAQRLSDAARDASRPQTRAEYAAEVITGSLT